jgi:hypothetical protein
VNLGTSTTTLQIFKNGTAVGSPQTIANATWFPAADAEGNGTTGDTFTAKFSNLSFSYSGYQAWDSAGAAPPVAAGTQVAPAAARTAMTPVAGGPANRVSGTIVSVNGAALTVETRKGRSVSIDAADAQQARQSVALFPGQAITASGAYDAQGTLRARSIVRAKPSRALWQPDQ